MSYKTIHRGGQGEIEEKKSRFIATVAPIRSEDEALAFLAGIRKKYWDARHNCFAYTLGAGHELQRCSDDGEPSGTAGRPMLSVLTGEDIHNCIVVVTRYFGGTLLGTGGLIRAYQAATQAGLAASMIIERQDGQAISIRADYNQLGRLNYLIAQNGVFTLDTRYADTVELDLIIPLADAPSFIETITEATGATAHITLGDTLTYAEADGKLLVFSGYTD